MTRLLAIIGWSVAVACAAWAASAERHYIRLAIPVAENTCDANVVLNEWNDPTRPDPGVRHVRISYDGTKVLVGPPREED